MSCNQDLNKQKKKKKKMPKNKKIVMLPQHIHFHDDCYLRDYFTIVCFFILSFSQSHTDNHRTVQALEISSD